MNERIKELAKQAMVIRGRMKVIDEDKFAELIVMECAEICTDSYHLGDAGTGDGFGITAADKRCAELIKQHFGVKE